MVRSILLKSLVKPYYRQNAGQFLFLFIVFFGVVAPSQQPAYHYALILGILETPVFFALVLLAWLLYGIKCSGWVTDSLEKPEYVFLSQLACLNGRQSYRLLLEVQLWLYLPVSIYSLAVTGVALYKGWYVPAIIVPCYVLLVCLAGAWQYNYYLLHPGKGANIRLSFRYKKKEGSWPYWMLLMRYLLASEKALLAGIKLFSCSMLYLLLSGQDRADYDGRMAFLFYSFGLFGHGVLIFRLRKLEDEKLIFYRGLPVSLFRRFWQYAILYFLVLMPEILVLGWLTPHPLRVIDALGFILPGYGLLLLMNSIMLVAPVKMSDFLKLNFLLFGVLYFCLLAGVLMTLSGVLFIAAVALYYMSFYRYEN
jgi:hypothetical protein